MENRGLLFIPDISGFTRFVNETEIDHSRMIIQELLEVLINANRIGLEVSEIEGDAILFYKFGGPPELSELYGQVETMFCAFHKNLIAYEQRRYCQCKACISAIDLTLKVVTHYGEFTGYNVKNFSKLIGKDIIVAHQLLKNDIEQHEYWLVTKNLVHDAPPAGLAGWMKWSSGARQTESGTVPFHYTQLSALKHDITAEPLPKPELAKKLRLISQSQVYQTDIITLFHATGDFNFRNKWWVGVKKVEEVNHFLPRVGMKCRCIMEDGGEVIYVSNYYYYQPDRIEFSETNERDKSITYYTLERLSGSQTKLTIDLYLEKNITGLLFKLMKKRKMEDVFRRSLENLGKLAAELDFHVE